MPDIPYAPIAQQHLYNVESNLQLWISECSQVVESRLRQQSAFSSIHRSCRAGPRLRRTGLHFNEDQTIAVAKHQINFTAAASKIRHQKVQTDPMQMSSSRTLP
jgi:hypothetical protein